MNNRSIRRPTGLLQQGNAATEAPEQVVRAFTTVQDLKECLGLLALDVLSVEAPPLEGILLATTIARCIPNLTADAFLPTDMYKAMHFATDLMTPWGFATGLTTAVFGDPNRIFQNAAQANMIVDLFLFARADKDARELISEGILLEGTHANEILELNKKALEVKNWLEDLFKRVSDRNHDDDDSNSAPGESEDSDANIQLTSNAGGSGNESSSPEGGGSEDSKDSDASEDSGDTDNDGGSGVFGQGKRPVYRRPGSLAAVNRIVTA